MTQGLGAQRILVLRGEDIVAVLVHQAHVRMHADGESLWRKGRLLVYDRSTGRCRCLVESIVGGTRGAMTEEVVVSGDAVLPRDMNQPDADVDNLTSGINADNDASFAT